MTKLSKQMYYNAKGEKKINCYKVNISKEIVNKTNITDKDELQMEAKDNQIIIKKEAKNENN